MEQQLKSKLKSIVIEIRHLLEGYYDRAGNWIPGDLELKLITLGIRRNESPIDISSLDETEAKAREIAIAFIQNIVDAGGNQNDAITEFIRETAYTWANRLIALRCMEARSIIDEVILQKQNYGGRSLQHHRLIQRNPDLASSLDDGLYSVLFAEFTERAKELPSIFDSNSIKIALRPNVSAIQKCIELLSAPDEIFSATDALGWAYQYWNTEEKDRVFERVKTVKNAKIEKLDIIPATQLYTEPYMVKFLVQNSLGATWYQMHPNTKLIDKWEYFVKDADRAPIKKKSIKEISFLDPCVGSGHFHLEAFDLFYDMYVEEGFDSPSEICRSIFENNLYGIDIDERAIQISAASLFMKAKEIAPDFIPKTINLVATNIHLSREKDHIEEYLDKYPEDKPLRNALVTIFDGLKHADELGSLLQIEEPVEKELKFLKSKEDDERAFIDDKLKDSLFQVTTFQGHLPLDVDSYDDWKKKVVLRLKNHFENETKGRSVSNKLFGEAVGKGLSLFDFLSRKYDIVATNPPYLGANMGLVFANYINKNYYSGRDDAYAAFIIRCVSLAWGNGKIAMVTQHSWMFLRSFSDLRSVAEDKISNSHFNGILRETTIESLAHLGEHGFSDSSAAGAFVVCFILSNQKVSDQSKISAFRLVGLKTPEEKSNSLRNCKKIIKKRQIDFLNFKECPIIYWFTDRLTTILSHKSFLSQVAVVGEGIGTSNNARFIRFFYELSDNKDRWFELSKGGRYKKWSGLRLNQVEWFSNGVRIKNYISEKYPYLNGNIGFKVKNEESYFSSALTYSTMARGSMGVRLIENTIFDNSGSFIELSNKNSNLLYSGILNSRVTSFILNSITQSLTLKYKYVQNFILPEFDKHFSKSIEELSNICYLLSKSIDSFDLTEMGFQFSKQNYFDYLLKISIKLLSESIIDDLTNSLFNLDAESIDLIYNEKGLPAGKHPMIKSHSNISLQSEVLPKANYHLFENHCTFDFVELNETEIQSIKIKLKILYEAGFGYKVDEMENEDKELNFKEILDEESKELNSAKIPIPCETFLEELSQKMEINPISIYWLLKEGIEKEGWRSIPEERKYTLDRFTVYILRLLGHRWPLQIEANEPLPDWADTDGIIPISQDTGEVTLYGRLRERIAEDFGESNISKEENYFNEVVGTTLERWHRKDFFKHHTSQFKKRPIAWHITSNSRPRRNTEAAFEAVLYYQKIDGDFFPKVRTQYLALVLRKFKTELNSLERYESKTGEQSARIIFLEELIQELETFDRTIQTLILSGFDTPALKKIAVDDAEQVLAIEWRKKITELFNNSKNDVSQFVEETFTELKYTYLQQFEYKLIESQKKFNEDLTAQVEELYSNMSKELTLSRPRKNGELINFESENDLRKWFSDRRGKFVIEAKKWFNENLSAFLTNWIKQDLKTYTKKAGKDAVQSLHSAINKSFEIMKEMITNIEFNGIDELESWGMNLDIYDNFCRIKPNKAKPTTFAEFIHQEMSYLPDINDGVRVNIAPLQKLGILQDIVLQPKDISKAIADRAEWRSDERRWCRDEKLPIPGWWD